jgi:hypothetical protein
MLLNWLYLTSCLLSSEEPSKHVKSSIPTELRLDVLYLQQGDQCYWKSELKNNGSLSDNREKCFRFLFVKKLLFRTEKKNVVIELRQTVILNLYITNKIV